VRQQEGVLDVLAHKGMGHDVNDAQQLTVHTDGPSTGLGAQRRGGGGGGGCRDGQQGREQTGDDLVDVLGVNVGGEVDEAQQCAVR